MDDIGIGRLDETDVSRIETTYAKVSEGKKSTDILSGNGGLADQEADTSAVYKANRRANFQNLQNQHSWFSNCKETPQDSDSQVVQIQSGQDNPRRDVSRDKKGRRVDLPLTFLVNIVDKMERTHYCNSFHLHGHCGYPKCKHLHMVRHEETGLLRRLNAEETETLRYIARRSPCRYGTACDVVDCWAGHRCINHIKKGKRSCCFPENMHFEFAEPVN